MSDYGWNLSVPSDDLYISQIPSTMRDIKDQLATRIDVEHTAVTTGSDDSDCGGQHLEGSAKAYVQASAPTTRPLDGAGEALTNDDQGRLWVDSDDGTLTYYKDTVDAWEAIGLTGGFDGDDFAVLNGRSGGQGLYGGTAAAEALTLGGSYHASGGPIVLHATKATGITTNSVAFTDLTLANAMDAGGFVIGDVGASGGTAGNALSMGDAVITKDELSTSGNVPLSCFGTAAGAGANLAADIGFAPDFVLGWNNVTDDPLWAWSSSHASANKNASSKNWITSSLKITVSSTTVTFPDGGNGYVNRTGQTMYYFALKFNGSVNPS